MAEGTVSHGGTAPAEARRGPIGIFDSGVGGLSLLAELRRQLPHEDVLYVADSAYAPYGSRPDGEIADRSLHISALLVTAGAKALLVACNTATAVAVRAVRQAVAVPVVAIEPAVKPAAEMSRTGVIGVLATPATLASEAFQRLTGSIRDVQLIARPCEGLVEAIERGRLDGPEVRRIVSEALGPISAAGADTVVLGCTHYPLVRPVIEDIAGPGVTVIDPAAAVIRHLRARLGELNVLTTGGRPGTLRFMTSGDPASMQAVLVALGYESPEVRALTDL